MTPFEMLNSRAYRALSHAAGKALPLFLAKVKIPYTHLQRYSEPFRFPYSEAMKYGFSRRTFWRIIVELMDRGFIDPVAKGGLKSCGKGCNVFKLSQRWMKYGTSTFTTVRWGTFHQDK
jgi:hypothetical protein